LALCRLQPRFRLLSLLCLIGFAHQIAHWSLILFYGGFIFAELDIRRQPTASRSGAKTRTNLFWSTTYIIVFLCGLYLGGQPETNLENAPGWNSLIAWIPEPFGGIFIRLRYWTMWGALLVVWSTSNSLILQRLFNHKVSQYLGKISFGFYLVHGCVIQTVGYLLFAFIWSITGYETPAKKEAGFVSASIIIFAITIWVADIFTRLVDTPTLRFARWLERKCLMKHGPHGRSI
jgi:peptidoglycan/LPS O-acetylase OafA/YrhL